MFVVSGRVSTARGDTRLWSERRELHIHDLRDAAIPLLLLGLLSELLHLLELRFGSESRVSASVHRPIIQTTPAHTLSDTHLGGGIFDKSTLC